MRFPPIAALAAALAGLGSHCPEPPPPVPESRVFFDSGVPLRVHLRGGDEVRGQLLTRFGPGAQRFVLCDERAAPCASRDGPGARTIVVADIERLRHRTSGALKGVGYGLNAGVLTATARDPKWDQEGTNVLLTVAGGVAGGLVGSAVTLWPTLASRDSNGRLLWPDASMVFPSPGLRREFVTSGCTRGDSTERIVAVVGYSNQAYYTSIVRAWQMDDSPEGFTPVPASEVRCRNALPLYRAFGDTVKAPTHAAAATMEFAAPPGKARLYLYHVPAFIKNRFTVTLDRQAIGRLDYGRFLMVDVDSGNHRLGAVDVPDSLVFHARADSVYFIKLMPGSWTLTGVYLTAQIVNPVEGQKLIRSSELMPPIYADGPLTVQRTQGALLLTNAAEQPIAYFIVEGSRATASDQTACATMACPTVPPRGSITIREREIVEFDRPGRRAVVYWWRSDRGSRSADEAGRVVVPY